MFKYLNENTECPTKHESSNPGNIFTDFMCLQRSWRVNNSELYMFNIGLQETKCLQGTQIEGRLESLNKFAAFIRKPNFRRKILELIITKHTVF